MIHFAIGTKAQFIKMAPVMRVLERAAEPYHLLDLSQHGSLTGQILQDFGLTPAISRFGLPGRSVETYAQAARWLAHGLLEITLHRSRVRRHYFLDAAGVVLLHGDTLSTILGLYLARAAGLPAALVEAGLTSRRLFDPFPEEWVRRHVARRARILFAPDAAAERWLRNAGYPGEIVNTGYNTGRDALNLIAMRSPPVPVTERYGVVTLHRLETLANKRRLRRAIEHIVAISEIAGPMRFYMHPPTENALVRAGLYAMVTSAPQLRVGRLQPYPDFVRELMGARFIITDGGSIQEEAFYLGKFCLILRNTTERTEGIGTNARLTTWNVQTDVTHLQQAKANAAPIEQLPTLGASSTIVRTLKERWTG
jgi:UDP-N-acetylglucosamine 2-epimerase (non-hydrolysing)